MVHQRSITQRMSLWYLKNPSVWTMSRISWMKRGLLTSMLSLINSTSDWGLKNGKAETRRCDNLLSNINIQHTADISLVQRVACTLDVQCVTPKVAPVKSQRTKNKTILSSRHILIACHTWETVSVYNVILGWSISMLVSLVSRPTIRQQCQSNCSQDWSHIPRCHPNYSLT